MHFIGDTPDELYMKVLPYLQAAKPVEGRGEPTKELMHVQFELLNPRNRLVSLRDINPAFAFVEVLWILAGGNNVKYLEFWNPRMKMFAQDNGMLYGAYGHRLGAGDFWFDAEWDEAIDEALYIYNPYQGEVNQLLNAYDALKDKPNSRQIILQIWNYMTDLPNYDEGGDERAKDIPCNLMSHLLVRGGKLHWLQVMRSNDAVWGWPYNLIQWTFLQEIMSGWLGLDMGPFVLLSDSFHTYQKHWDNIPQIISRDAKRKGIGTEHPAGVARNSYALPFDVWKRSFAAMIVSAYNMTICSLGEEPDCITDALNDGMHMAYYPLMGMLAAEADRIKSQKNTPNNLYDYTQELAKNLMTGGSVNDTYWYRALLRWWEAKAKGVIV